MLRPMNYLLVYLVLITSLAATCIRSQDTLVSQKRVRFLREPVDTVAVIGSSVEITCGPQCDDAPDGRCLFVTWTHNGALVEYSSRTVKSSNGSLILKNLRRENEGIYQCVVIVANYGVFLSRRARLTVARLGPLVEGPEDVIDAISNGAVRFKCSAGSAVPTPNVTWYHDGSLLTNDSSNGRRVTLPHGILQISRLEQSDLGVYSCIVSNIAGTITSRNATLNMSEGAPVTPDQILKVIQGPENVTVARGQTAVFECLVQLSESTVWKRIDESPLSSKAFISGGNLFIPDVSPSDEGLYGCITKASGKSLTLSASLSVDWPPVIVKPPEETRRYRGESWRFICYTSAKPAPEIIWYKNGERLRSHGRIKMFPNEQQLPSILETPAGTTEHVRDLLITSIEVDDTAVYQCSAENYLGSATAAAALIYQETVELGAPTNLTASVLPNQRELELTWKLPPVDLTNRSVIFIVHFHESESGSENTMAVKSDACSGNVCKAICCSNINLSPYTNYTFWVDALLDYHQTAPKFTKPSARVFVRSGDATASASTSILLQETPDPETVRLSWRQPSVEYVKGEVTDFRLEMKTDGTAPGGLVQWRRPVVIPRQMNEYLVTGIELGVVLYFRMIPRTRAGYPSVYPPSAFPWLRYQRTRASPSTNRTRYFTEAPGVETLSMNSTSIFVRWTKSNATGENFGLAKWSVIAARSNDPQWLSRAEVDREEDSVILFGLSPDTLYQITVYLSTSDGLEGLRASRLVKTAPSSRSLSSTAPLSGGSARMIVPYPIPHCQPAGPGKLLVTWDKPPMNTGIALVTLRYSLLPLDSDEALNASVHVKTVETSGSQMIFTDLLPGRTYLFAARAHTKSGYKSVYSHDINCSVPLAKPPPPQQVEAAITNGSLVVWWTPAEITEGSGRILTYHVRYSPNADNSGWTEVPVPGSKSSVVISSLESPSSLYHVTVSAENEAGRGDESRLKVARSQLPSTVGDEAAYSLDKPETDTDGATIIFRTSYKEGVIIGVCIGILCAVVSAIVLFLRSRRDRDGCLYRILFGHRGTGAKLANGGPKTSGRPNGEVHCVELKEMQTLLPQLMENVESDSKGADICLPSNRPNVSLLPPSDRDGQRPAEVTQSLWSQKVPVSTCLGSPGSDRSRNHCPNGSVSQAWALENGTLRPVNGDWRKRCSATWSMPNLLDLEQKRVLVGNGHILANGPTRLIEEDGRIQSHMNGAPKNGCCNQPSRQESRRVVPMAPLTEKEDLTSGPGPSSSLQPGCLSS